MEIESDIEGNSVTPTQDQIDFLRTTLNELSLHAQEAQDSELSDIHLDSHHDETISSWTTPEIGAGASGSLTTGSSGSSISSLQSFGSPLGFLQAALPEVSTARLAEALEESGKTDIDMWDIVANILTEESIREMEERGWDGLEEKDGFADVVEEEGDWETIGTKKQPRSKPEKRKIHPRPKKIALADIRQQHHLHSHPHSSLRRTELPTKHPPRDVAADPWTQLTSLSDHLATLLPPNPPSLFLSFFHSPKYGRSYDALRAALASLSNSSDGNSDQHTTILYNILDVVLPEYDYEESDMDRRSRIISDVQLAVAVTQGEGDQALDVVNVLRDLDTNSDLGLYHSQETETWADSKPSTSPTRTTLPSGPPPVQPPRVSRVKLKPPPSTPSGNKPSPFQWQAIPHRKPRVREAHPLAHHIPAYTRDVNGNKTHRATGSKGSSTSDNGEFRQRMSETMQKRREALREAARMWQRGNSKSRGGEIAFYFAERVILFLFYVSIPIC